MLGCHTWHANALLTGVRTPTDEHGRSDTNGGPVHADRTLSGQASHSYGSEGWGSNPSGCASISPSDRRILLLGSGAIPVDRPAFHENFTAVTDFLAGMQHFTMAGLGEPKTDENGPVRSAAKVLADQTKGYPDT